MEQLLLVTSCNSPAGIGVSLRTVWERQGHQGTPLRHMEQLLLVTSCDSPAGVGASLWTDTRTDRRTNGRKDAQT